MLGEPGRLTSNGWTVLCLTGVVGGQQSKQKFPNPAKSCRRTQECCMLGAGEGGQPHVVLAALRSALLARFALPQRKGLTYKNPFLLHTARVASSLEGVKLCRPFTPAMTSSRAALPSRTALSSEKTCCQRSSTWSNQSGRPLAVAI